MILVTGGAGFIGSHVCRKLLERGENVAVFDNFSQGRLDTIKSIRMPDMQDQVEFINGDITNFPAVFEALRKHDVRKIVHTAAITFIPTAISNPSMTFNINTAGSFNLLEAARILDLEKFVYVSTSSTYGDFQYTPADEKHPLEPKDIYGATKAAADRLAASYHKTYGMPVSIVRTSSVYGPGDMEKRVVKNFVENALQGKPLELQGGGEQRRDFSYVKDVAEGIMLSAMSEKADGEVFNITGGTDHSIAEVAELIMELVPGTEIIKTEGRKVDINRGKLDISKAKEFLGYEPAYDLRKGITEYMQWVAGTYAPAFNMEIKNRPVKELA